MKKKLLASALLAASLVTLGTVASASESLPNGTTVLETVDGVTVATPAGSQSTLLIEGVVQGETQAREFAIYFAGAEEAQDRCAKLALLAQTHPGRYNLELSRPASRVVCKLKSR